jgi:predicted peptidase
VTGVWETTCVRAWSAVGASAVVVVVIAAGAGSAVGGRAVGGYSAQPQQLVPGEHVYSSTVGHVRVNYLLYAPAGYANRARRWPLVVFLHGSGGIGTDPRVLEEHPLPQTLAATTRFPAVVFSPQLPPRFVWWSDLIPQIDALVRRFEARYRIDPQRIYLTGLSLGGFGTWSYALQHPRRFAALVPIAGGYIQGSSAVPADICALRRVPIWVFHGADDTVVYPYQSEVLVRALRKCGSRVLRFTLYPGVDHLGTWPRAYHDAALWRWLFAKRRR